MKKLLLFILLLFSASAFAANSVYIAQTLAGLNDGSSCANAKAFSYFNTVGNWSATPAGIQIGPDTTVHLCGTFNASAGASGYLAFQASGTTGHPVTLLWESGAIVQAPYWGANGAIYISGLSNIIIDGGTNGLIQATLNGTSGGVCPGGTCSNQQVIGAGVFESGANAVEVKNLTIANMYVRTSTADTTQDGGLHHPWAIGVWNTSNAIIDNNIIHDMEWGIWVVTLGTITNLDIHNNEIYNTSVAIGGGDGGANDGFAGAVNIYGNYLHDFWPWDNPADTYHHDAIYLWLNQTGSTWTGTYNIYNNRFMNLANSGTSNCTAFIYLDNTPNNNTYPQAYVFNNVFDLGADVCGDNILYDKTNTGHLRFYNNTVLRGPLTAAGAGASQILENNISGSTQGLQYSGASIATSNYNDWYNLTNNPVMVYTASYSTFAAYKTATGFDANSITTSPNLTAGYVPNAGSPVIGTGVNLFAVCNGQPNPGLGALCFDKAGVARPTVAAWDMGAYQFSSSTPVVAPAASMFALVHP